MKTYLHADDFGWNNNICSDIADCIELGSINSISIIINSIKSKYPDVIVSSNSLNKIEKNNFNEIVNDYKSSYYSFPQKKTLAGIPSKKRRFI